MRLARAALPTISPHPLLLSSLVPLVDGAGAAAAAAFEAPHGGVC